MVTKDALTFKGLQVPWVTRWTGEIPVDPMKVDIQRVPGGLRLSYPGNIGFRDKHGVLWQEEGIRRGGEPQFAHVSAHRQRTAMNHRLCQVCGHKITDRPIRWLMAPNQLSQDIDGATTVSPPTCNDCVDVALKACPHLRTHDQLILNVLEYRVWGVWGDVVRLENRRLQRARGVNIPYDERVDLGAVLAKQQVVQFTKYTIERQA